MPHLRQPRLRNRLLLIKCQVWIPYLCHKHHQTLTITVANPYSPFVLRSSWPLCLSWFKADGARHGSCNVDNWRANILFLVQRCSSGKELLVVFNTSIQYEDQVKSLPLLVVKSVFLDAEQFQLKWSTVHSVRLQSGLNCLLQQHKLFREEVGLLKGMKAKIYVADDAQPCLCKLRRLPYCLKWRKNGSYYDFTSRQLTHAR